MIKKIKLEPTNQKSFYGKTWVIKREDGITELQSYDTIVGFIDNGQFHRTWDDFSVTTMNHVNAFLHMFGLPKLNKAKWNALPIANTSYNGGM